MRVLSKVIAFMLETYKTSSLTSFEPSYLSIYSSNTTWVKQHQQLATAVVHVLLTAKFLKINQLSLSL